ncbi:MAG TPA: hypothetical protein PLB59_10030 [Bacteroidales bacterium]|nr:hypothetical protein [Bacteroidales bacterium]HQN16624.1 hypothetical protein [Bacteroidales bacterium]HQP16294.1 hypothetical protein [Bacteroidales bacterium]
MCKENVKFEACPTAPVRRACEATKSGVPTLHVGMSIFVASVTLPDASGEKIGVFLQTRNRVAAPHNT